MADQVIIEIVGDTTKLQAQLQQVDNQMKQTAGISQQAFSEFNKANQTAEAGTKQLTTNLQDLNKVVATGAISQYGKEVMDVATKHVSLRAQVQQAKQALVEMAETGKKGTQAWKDQKDALEKAATQLREVNKLTANLGSQTKVFAGFIDAARGVAAGFEVMKGASVLFGSENEKTEKVIKELVSAMAILNGLQEIQLVLKEDSAAMQLILNGQEAIGVAITKLDTAAKSENIIVSKAASAAQWLLNEAMEANPALLLVGALGAVVAALLYFTDDTKEAMEAQIKLNEGTKAEIELFLQEVELVKRSGEEKVKAAEQNVKLLKAQKATTEEQRKAEVELADIRIKAAQDEETLLRQKYSISEKNLAIYEAEQKAALQSIEIKQKEKDAAQAVLNLKHSEEEDPYKISVEISRAKEKLKNIDEEIKLEKSKYENSTKLLEAYNATKDKLDAATNAKAILAAQQQKEIELEGYNQAIKDLENKRVLTEKGSAEDLALFKKIQTEKYLIAKANGESPEALKALHQQQYLEYETYYGEVLKLKVDADHAALEKLKSNANEEANFIRDHDKHKAEIEAAYNSMSFEDFKVWEQKKRDEYAKTDAWEKSLEEEAVRHKKELANIELQQEADIQKAKIEAEKQAVQEIFKLASQIEQQIFELEASNRQVQLDADIAMMEKEKTHALNNKTLTAAQIEAINEKYRRIEAAAKLKAWKADQKAAEEKAGIDMALGIINAWATASSWVQALIQTAAVVAAGTASIAIIASKQPPAFEKGGKDIPGGMKLVGEKGPELIYTPGGETIIPHGDTAKILEAWSIPMPQVPQNIKTDTAIGPAMPVINVKEMAAAFAQELRNNPQVNVSIDKNGVHVHVASKNRKVEVLNNYYGG